MSHFLAVSNPGTSRGFQAVFRCFGSWSQHRESLIRKVGPGSIDESPTHQETVPVTLTNRPSLARLFAALLLLSSLFMALLGMSASAYFVPAACLLLQAVLVWRGKGLTLFKRIIELNQITGIVLILVLDNAERFGQMDPTAVVATTISVVIGWLAGVFRVYSQLRFPIYDSTESSASKTGPNH